MHTQTQTDTHNILSSLPPDTEGSFIVERVAEVATAAVRHLKSMADDNSDEGNK